MLIKCLIVLWSKDELCYEAGSDEREREREHVFKALHSNTVCDESSEQVVKVIKLDVRVFVGF